MVQTSKKFSCSTELLKSWGKKYFKFWKKIFHIFIFRIFCANHTIDEVYKTKFLQIVEQVKSRVKTSINRLGDDGIEILNLVIPKPVIPSDIAENYKQVKVQWTKQLVAEQEKLTKEKLKETEEMEVSQKFPSNKTFFHLPSK